MIEGLSPLGPVRGPAMPAPAARPEPAEGGRSFKEILKDSIDSVNQLQREADQVLEKLGKGGATDTEVAVAFRKSQIAFEAMQQIRDKVVGAFEEIQRMRI